MNATVSAVVSLRQRIACLFLLSFLVAPTQLFAEDKALRVVSVGGALTEIIYQLGAESQLVGVDTTSLYPEAATKLPQDGYQRALSAEGVLSLNPSIVLATDQAGPPAVIKQIKLAGIEVLIIPTKYSAAGVVNKINQVSQALGLKSAGAKMAEDFLAEMDTLSNTEDKNIKTDVMFLLNVGKGSPMAAGIKTAADAMIVLAGASNVMKQYEGYKPVSTEAIVVADPEVLLLPQRTIDALGGQSGVLGIAGVNVTRAGKKKRVVAMEGLYMLGFTPRLPEAVRDLSKLLHSTKALESSLAVADK